MRILRSIWSFVSHVSIVAWLVSLATGGAVSAIVASFVNLGAPYQAIFFACLLVLVASMVLPFARFSVALISEWAPRERPVTLGDISKAQKAAHELLAPLNKQADKRAVSRVILQGVITTLEQHKTDVERFTKAQSPLYRGKWPDERSVIAEQPRYDKAYRATERAFQAISFHVGEAAIAPIDEALLELEAALEADS